MITAANPLSVDLTAPTDDEPRYTIETESYSSDFAVMRVSGDLDLTARIHLVDALDRLVENCSHVVIDLAAVSFMYSGAANAVIDAATATASSVQIFAPTRPVRMILDVLGAGDLVVDTLPQAGISS